MSMDLMKAEIFAVTMARRIHHSHLIGFAQTWVVDERHVNGAPMRDITSIAEFLRLTIKF